MVRNLAHGRPRAVSNRLARIRVLSDFTVTFTIDPRLSSEIFLSSLQLEFFSNLVGHRFAPRFETHTS
jgi:hypothetical protein